MLIEPPVRPQRVASCPTRLGCSLHHGAEDQVWDNPDDEMEVQHDINRQALTQLLHARGEQHAAGIVAVIGLSQGVRRQLER
jgi:hypothetical protein